MKAFIFIALSFFFSSCNNGTGFRIETDTVSTSTVVLKDTGIADIASAGLSRFHNPDLENRITDTLMTLPFVRESSRFIDSFSHHTHGMAFMIDSSADGITVMAGYNGPVRFETYYNFNINPGNFAITVSDVYSGELVTVEECIKKSKQVK